MVPSFDQADINIGITLQHANVSDDQNQWHGIQQTNCLRALYSMLPVRVTNCCMHISKNAKCNVAPQMLHSMHSFVATPPLNVVLYTTHCIIFCTTLHPIPSTSII